MKTRKLSINNNLRASQREQRPAANLIRLLSYFPHNRYKQVGDMTAAISELSASIPELALLDILRILQPAL